MLYHGGVTSLADIGDRLIEARRAAGLTQRDLAERLGIRQQQVARWEREQYGCVSLSRLSRVAQALGVSPERVCAQPLLAAEEPATYGAVATIEPTAAPADSAAPPPVRDLGEAIARIRLHADELHERFGVTHIAVFGSFARGEQRPDSDVDLIVEIEHPSLENVFGAERRLGELMGRQTETGSIQAVNPRVRKSVEEDLVDVWKA